MDLLPLIGLLTASILAGSMVFFSFVVAPLVFIKLDGPTAGGFIRALFPWYYLVVIALALATTLALLGARPLEASLAGLVLVGGVFARQWLMPRINASRDRMQTDPEAGTTFHRLHRASVWLNAVQILIVLAVLVRLGMAAD